MKNKHGLSRRIPESDKKNVRRRCGFGCVICGMGIYQYDHLTPEFKDCTKHDPNRITLLCGTHHDQKNRGFLPIEIVEKANENPFSKKNGFWGELFFWDQFPKLFLGSNEINRCNKIFIVHNKTLLQIEEREEKGAPFRLSGLFCDHQDNIILEIKNNEWFGNPQEWDVKTEGGKIQIRLNDPEPLTLLEIDANRLPDSIIFSEMNLGYKGNKFIVKDGEFSLETLEKGRVSFVESRLNFGTFDNSFVVNVDEDNSIKGIGYF